MSTRRSLTPEERAWLEGEVRRRQLAKVAAQRKADLRLFEGDPGYVGPGPQTPSAAWRHRHAERKR